MARARRRSRKYRKRRKGRRLRRGRTPSVRKLASQVRSLRKSQEIKHKEAQIWDQVAIGGIAVVQGFAGVPLSGLPGEGDRTSAEVMIKYCRVKWTFTTGQAVIAPNDIYNEVRFLIVARKRRDNSAAPAWGDLFLTGHVNAAYQTTNKDLLSKWKVLYDSKARTVGKIANAPPRRSWHRHVFQSPNDLYRQQRS